MTAVRKALRDGEFTFSSELTMALEVPPREVRTTRVESGDDPAG